MRIALRRVGGAVLSVALVCAGTNGIGRMPVHAQQIAAHSAMRSDALAWATYTNKAWRYSFRYPSVWVALSSPNSDIVLGSLDGRVGFAELTTTVRFLTAAAFQAFIVGDFGHQGAVIRSLQLGTWTLRGTHFITAAGHVSQRNGLVQHFFFMVTTFPRHSFVFLGASILTKFDGPSLDKANFGLVMRCMASVYFAP